jgi:multiple sugar transport system permease protein
VTASRVEALLVQRGASLARIGLLLAFAAFLALPLVWLLLAPSKTNDGLLAQAPLSFGSFDHYVTSWRDLATYTDHNSLILRWVLNSIWYGAASVAIAMATAVPAGYALAFFRFPGRKLILIATLVTMLIPPSSLVLPLFLELTKLQLVGSPVSVILPLSFYPFGTFLAYIYFSTSLPRDLLGAARIDGCSELRVFWHVVLPLARTIVPVVAFFCFVRAWNEFFLPYLMLTDDHTFTLPIGLTNLVNSTSALVPVGPTSRQWPISRPEVALAGLIAIIPIVVAFVAAQRTLRSGTLAGFDRD